LKRTCRSKRYVGEHSAQLKLCPPLAVVGEGHTCFALGPIIFCKICGGTRSSSGNLLNRACRGWAPPGTMGHVKALLKGRPCSGFYRKLLIRQCTPLRRLACKTKPVVRCLVPRHLIEDDEESADEDSQAPRPNLVRRTVYLGAAMGPLHVCCTVCFLAAAPSHEGARAWLTAHPKSKSIWKGLLT
jgi:hypothetical protein